MSSPPLRTGSFRSFLQKAWKEEKKKKGWVGESSALIVLVVLIGGGEVHRES